MFSGHVLPCHEGKAHPDALLKEVYPAITRKTSEKRIIQRFSQRGRALRGIPTTGTSDALRKAEDGAFWAEWDGRAGWCGVKGAISAPMRGRTGRGSWRPVDDQHQLPRSAADGTYCPVSIRARMARRSGGGSAGHARMRRRVLHGERRRGRGPDPGTTPPERGRRLVPRGPGAVPADEAAR